MLHWEEVETVVLLGASRPLSGRFGSRSNKSPPRQIICTFLLSNALCKADLWVTTRRRLGRGSCMKAWLHHSDAQYQKCFDLHAAQSEPVL